METTIQLKHDLDTQDSMIKSVKDSLYWVPFDRIQTLVQDAKVEKILKEVQQGHCEAAAWTPESIKRLKKFVCEKALRIFALLVSQDLVHLLELFYENDFGDEMFPIEESANKGTLGWTIKSIKTEREVKYEVKIEKWDRTIRNICQHQWEFFVPVFKEGDPVYQFSPLCQVPFLREEEPDKKKVTNFSIVRHFVIHRCHLNFSNTDQIVRNDFRFLPTLNLAYKMLTYIGRYGR